MNAVKFILSVVFLLTLAAPSRALQIPGGRESFPTDKPNPTLRKPKRPARPASEDRGRKFKPATATLSINVKPGDSTINLQGVEYRAENGVFIRNGLTPGKYRIVIHKDGYQNQAYDLSLGPGNDGPLNVSLELLNGILNIVPLISDTEIRIIEMATDKSVGAYSGLAQHVELPPGRYQVFISKEGYKTMVRDVTIEPTGNVSLEPSLIPLPKPAATVRRTEPSFQRDYAMQAQARFEGKFVVVVLAGRSSDTVNALGAVDITLRVGGGQAQVINLSGMLTGYPCQVDFVRLENVAEYSFVEPPGAANQWARAVVRLRPKDSKRPVHFLINWKSLRSAVSDRPPAN